MGKGRQEYELDMGISLEGLKMQGPPGESPNPAQIFYNVSFSVLSALSESTKGFNGMEHDIVRNIRLLMEQAADKKDTKIVLRDREIRFLNKAFVDARTLISTNEIRGRIKEKIQAALQNPVDSKDEVPKPDIERTAESTETKPV